MADQKITELTADNLPTKDDLLVTVSDPGGTPANRKTALSAVLFTQFFGEFRLIGVNARPNSTSTDTFGHSAVTPYGDSAANIDDANGPWIRRNTGASVGNTAGFVFNNGALIWVNWLPQISTKLMTFTDISSTLIWIGCFSGNPAGSNDPTLNGMAFRFSPAAGDTTWKAWTNDNAGGGTITDTGVTVSTSTAYILAILVESASSIKFFISIDNGVTFALVATHTSSLPTGSVGDFYFQVETRTTAARGMSHSYTYIRMR